MKEKKDITKKEEGKFEIPDELKREIIDIMNDSPDLKKIGDKQYRVYNLRPYSINRILKLGLDLCKDDPEDVTDDKKMIFSLCTDLERGCEIVSIILCNHLFTPDNVNKDDIDSVYTHNDNLIRYMKARIMNSTVDSHQWAAIILGALKSINLAGFFTMLILVKQYTDSLTKTREKAEEILESWREAKRVM
ncbi:MAG: hypothetical protein WCQ87_03500 [Parabacteroides sp.]